MGFAVRVFSTLFSTFARASISSSRVCAGLALLVGLALLGAGPALAQDEIPQKIIAPTDHGEPTDVDSADVDGDGDLDLISASRFDDKIAWYENQVGESGTGEDGFGAQQVITTDANFARSVAVGDLDGDGDPDVLSASERDDKIAWYENEVGESGTGEDGFGAQQVITTDAEEAQSVAVGDLDGDGDLDVLSASERDNKVAWHENQVGESGADEDGFGDQQVITTEAGEAQSVAVGDVDGDEDLDVLSASNGDVTSYSRIAWYENTDGVLPVELAGFGATVDDGAVQLSWQTASETGNAGFRVQRKRARNRGSESAWTTVGSVEGSGTTSQAQSYRFTDDNLSYEADKLTYRLKQVDTDGTEHFSGEVTVERGVQELELLGTYPNPARQRAIVRYALPETQDATVRLYDMLGRRVRTVVSGEQEGRHQRTLDVGALPSGVYFLRLRAGGETETQRLTVVQ